MLLLGRMMWNVTGNRYGSLSPWSHDRDRAGTGMHFLSQATWALSLLGDDTVTIVNPSECVTLQHNTFPLNYALILHPTTTSQETMAKQWPDSCCVWAQREVQAQGKIPLLESWDKETRCCFMFLCHKQGLFPPAWSFSFQLLCTVPLGKRALVAIHGVGPHKTQPLQHNVYSLGKWPEKQRR